jgi:sugar lactone lactonase YvrE
VHSYKAVFVEDGYGLSSASAASTLTVGPAKEPVYTDKTTLLVAGRPGNYSLTATVVGYGGTAAPTGNVSFLDTSFGNAALGSVPLGPATAGLGWLLSQTPAVSGSTPISQVTGDFNGDGIPDLALLCTTNIYGGTAAFTIFLGKDDGTFTAGLTTQTQIEVNDSIGYTIARDFNGDGKTDLALLTYPSGFTHDNVTTLLGNGDGTFVVSATSLVYNPGPVGGDVIVGSMVAADFNGDGKMDLAVVGDYVGTGGVTIVLGNGDGTFTATGTNLELTQGFGSVATGDFNGDGIPDLLATRFFGPGGGVVFLGKGDGTFTEMGSFTLDPFPRSILTGDVNGDGKLDVLFGYDSGVGVFLGNGDGTFTQAPGSPLSGGAGGLSAGDFNHDGKLDLAGIDNSIDLADVFLGAGDGTFTRIAPTATVGQDVSAALSLVAADFNGDGVPDLAMLTRNQVAASILLTEPTETASATVNHIAPVGAGTHNVDASYSGDTHYGSTVSAPVSLSAGLAPVVFSLPAGPYSSVQTVTLSESVPGAATFYSLTGTLSTGGYVPYTGPIPLTEGGAETIEAYATETGYQESNLSITSYYLNLPAVPTTVFSPAAGSYPGPQTVTITDSVAGATIYYTTNGALPTTSSSHYSGPISVSTSETLVAIAVANGYTMSAPTTAQYIIGSSSASLIYTLAGNGFSGYAGDGGPATLANLNGPGSSVVDSAGNLYIADGANNVIRKVAAGTGVISTIAGTGVSGYSGDHGAATSARLNSPTGLSLDGAGNLYFSDAINNAVRMIAATTGVITTVAGNGTPGYGGDGSAAVLAQLNYPAATTMDSAGNLYIADSSNSRIREVAAKTGIITTFAGNGQYGYAGDGGPATAAELEFPQGVVVDASGSVYLADTNSHVIRKVTAGTGVISTVAGVRAANSGAGSYSGDGGPASSAGLNRPGAVTLDSAGNLYIADSNNNAIRKVTASSGIIQTIAGNGYAFPCNAFAGDGGPAASATLCSPSGISIDSAGNLYIADNGFSRIRIVTTAALPPTSATAAPVITVPGGTYATPQTVTITDSTSGASIYLTTNGAPPSTSASSYNGTINVSGGVTIQAVAVAPGHLTSAPVSATYAITSPPATVIKTIAGNGVNGFAGAGGPAASAQLGEVAAMAADRGGNLFFTDTQNNVVWKVTAATGNLSIVAGNGTPGFSGDGGPATKAQLNIPNGIAVDSAGNLYIADISTSVVRRVDASTGLIETFAGKPFQSASPGQNGDGGPATQAFLNGPQGLLLDAAGNLYIADSFDNEVRVVSASSGIITGVAGKGTTGFSGEGGPATSASLDQPNSLAFDNAGNLYIGSVALGRVCKVTATTGILTTVAGNGNQYGSSGDGGLATAAEIYPLGLALDSARNLYISNGPGVIREVAASTGIITKAVGNGYPGYSGDGGSASIAQIQQPVAIVFDSAGNLYVADSGNYRVREVSPAAGAIAPTVTVSPSSTSVTTGQALTVAVSVAGAGGSPTPTGSVAVSGGGYNSQQALANGTATFSVAAGALSVGNDTLTATYTPDARSAGDYTSATQSAVVTVTQAIGTATATMTVSPSTATITNEQPVSVSVSVAGGSGQPAPTGNVTLAGGSYSAQQPLSSGSATFAVPAGALSAGSNTLMAQYSGDGYYSAASGTTTITVTPVVISVSNPAPVTAGGITTATVTFSAGSTYSGTVNLSCALIASPPGAQNLPTCSLKPNSVTISGGGNASTTLTVNTNAPNSSSAFMGSGRQVWKAWSGGGILALGILFGVPSWRRRRAFIVVVLCGISIAGVIGCGGGGATSPNTSPSSPATTAGTYTFSVTGTDSTNAKITASTHLTVAVQ